MSKVYTVLSYFALMSAFHATGQDLKEDKNARLEDSLEMRHVISQKMRLDALPGLDPEVAQKHILDLIQGLKELSTADSLSPQQDRDGVRIRYGDYDAGIGHRLLAFFIKTPKFSELNSIPYLNMILEKFPQLDVAKRLDRVAGSDLRNSYIEQAIVENQPKALLLMLTRRPDLEIIEIQRGFKITSKRDPSTYIRVTNVTESVGFVLKTWASREKTFLKKFTQKISGQKRETLRGHFVDLNDLVSICSDKKIFLGFPGTSFYTIAEFPSIENCVLRNNLLFRQFLDATTKSRNTVFLPQPNESFWLEI